MENSLDLVRLAQNGDTAAFAELVRTHNSMIHAQILRMMKDEQDTKDIVQLTWIKAWNKLDSFRFESAFSSWLYRVATFTALDAIRKKKSLRETSLDSFDQNFDSAPSVVASPNQIHNLESKELKEHFEKSIDKLPEMHREAIVLREIEGLSYAEIADRMKCKKGTVMSRIFNARKSLHHYMKEFLR